MTLIGRRCTGGDAFSRARLIARTLSGGAFAPRLPSGPVPVPLLSAAIVSADNVIEAATARRLHPFPFRTGQLSSGAPMVLRKRESRSPPSSSLPHFPSPSQEGGRGGGRVFCGRTAPFPSFPCLLSFFLSSLPLLSSVFFFLPARASAFAAREEFRRRKQIMKRRGTFRQEILYFLLKSVLPYSGTRNNCTFIHEC